MFTTEKMKTKITLGENTLLWLVGEHFDSLPQKTRERHDRTKMVNKN